MKSGNVGRPRQKGTLWKVATGGRVDKNAINGCPALYSPAGRVVKRDEDCEKANYIGRVLKPIATAWLVAQSVRFSRVSFFCADIPVG